MGIPFERSQRLLRHGEFYAQWRLEQDVLRAARAGGPLTVAVWAAIRARAGTRTRLEGIFAPTFSSIADEDLGMSLRSVQHQVAALEAAGMLAVDRPAGRKAVWILLPIDADPRTSCGGSPVENSDRPLHLVQGTPAPPAGDPRTTCTPVPPQESKERRESRSIGDDDFRKSELDDLDDDSESYRPLVREFAEKLERLVARSPASPDIAELENLVLDATDPGAWRALIDQVDWALAHSPHLQAADA